jgi:hypothetical protein
LFTVSAEGATSLESLCTNDTTARRLECHVLLCKLDGTSADTNKSQ